MDVHACTTLPSSVTTPAAARAFALEAMERGHASVSTDDVALVVSELVTNAVVHGDGDVRVDVTVATGEVRVEVADHERALPDRHDAPADAESGRGLAIVSQLARRWGVRTEGDGKVVWADLAV